MEYLASAVNVASFNSCIGPFPKVYISFFLLSINPDEFVSAPKIMAFFCCYRQVMKMLVANRILCRSCYICIYLYQHSQLALQLQINNLLEQIQCDHVSNSQTINNTVELYHTSFGERILLVVKEGQCFSFDNPLDSHFKIVTRRSKNVEIVL